MTQYSHYSQNLSASRIRHIASSTQNSYHKTNFMKNSNFLPIYNNIKKIAGPTIASFYLECDNKEADIQKRYRTLLAKSMSIEDRFRKIQHCLTLSKTQEEMNQTLQLYKEEKEKAVYLQPIQEEEEERNQKVYQFVLKLEKRNQLRAEKLKILSEKIEKERYILFQTTITDLSQKIQTNNGHQNYKKNSNQQLFNDSDSDYFLNDFEISDENEDKNPIIDDEKAQILYDQKQKRIEKLQRDLSEIKKVKKKKKIAQIKRNEAAKTLSYLVEKKNSFLFKSFTESNYKSSFENTKTSQNISSYKAFKSKIRQIQTKEKLLEKKKENLQTLLEEVEQENQKVIEKEKNVILMEQKILELRKKYDDAVYQSQKELDFFDFYSSLKSNSVPPIDSQYKDEFQKIMKSNSEF